MPIDDSRHRYFLDKYHKSVKKARFLKYVLIVVFFLLALVLTIYEARGANQEFIGSLMRSLEASLYATLLVTLVYDVFLRREQQQEQELILEHVASEVESATLQRVGFATLTDEEMSKLLDKAVLHPNFRSLLARRLGSAHPLVSDALRHILELLENGIVFRDVQIQNTMEPVDDSTTEYLWRFWTRFVWDPPEGANVYRVVVASDNDILSFFTPLPICHAAVGLSEFSEDVVKGMLQKNLKLSEICTDNHGHPVETPCDYHTLGRREIKSLDLGGGFDDTWIDHMAVLEFDVGNGNAGRKFEFEYKRKTSLLVQYLTWYADYLCFVDEIVFDYSKVKHLMAKVNTQNFVGTRHMLIRHDRNAGVVRAKVNSILLPGQGLSLNWTLSGSSSD